MSDAEDLQKLADLHQRGALSDEEFARAKARILAGSAQPNPGSFARTLHALRRSRYDRWLGGVCGGLGEFTEVPAWIWRVLFILFVICGGTGILLYILLWIVMPTEPVESRAYQAGYGSTP